LEGVIPEKWATQTKSENIVKYSVFALCIIAIGDYELVAAEESAAKHSDIWLPGYWMPQKAGCCPVVS